MRLQKQQKTFKKVRKKKQLFSLCLQNEEDYWTPKKVRNLREFYANGHIKEEESCFFINPKESNEQLIKCINQGLYILLQGVRGSGKTTRIMYAIKYQLSEYCALYISLQSLEYHDIRSFWRTFTKCLFQDNKHKINSEQRDIHDAEGFKE